MVDIQTPNYETRMAILSSKAAERGFTLQPNVLDYLATTITSNVRELEGSLLKLMMAAEVENKPITAEFASQVLRDLINRRQSQTTVKSVIQAISRYFDTEVVDIIGPRRQKELVYPRQIAMYLLRDIMHLSYPQIGDALGGRDHTTIMHGADKIEKEAKVNQATENDLKNIRQAIRD
jgi:chromosomal replication initiator protein